MVLVFQAHDAPSVVHIPRRRRAKVVTIASHTMQRLIHHVRTTGDGATSAKGYFMVLVSLARYVPLAARMRKQQKVVVGTIASHTMCLQIHHARVIGGGATNVRDCSTGDMLRIPVAWLAVHMLPQQRAGAGIIVCHPDHSLTQA